MSRGDNIVCTDDRGLAYGEGVFETIRVRNGRLPLLARHFQRLVAGLEALRIPVPDLEALRNELLDIASQEPEGVVKLIVTGGGGGQGYQAPANRTPRVLVQRFSLPLAVGNWQSAGMSVRICATPVEGPSALAGLKHLNRLSQVLARAEWGDEFDEGLMRDPQGRIVEGVRTNLFACINDVLLTPPIIIGVKGVMRDLVIELAHQCGIETEERYLDDNELANADELMLTNSVIGVCPVYAFEDSKRTIGTMIRKLQTKLENELERLSC